MPQLSLPPTSGLTVVLPQRASLVHVASSIPWQGGKA